MLLGRGLRIKFLVLDQQGLLRLGSAITEVVIDAGRVEVPPRPH